MKHLYLHIGFPKTGTTSIQTAITHNYQNLKDAGIISPGKGLYHAYRAHHHAAWSLDEHAPADYCPDEGTYLEMIEEIRESAGNHFLVSSEAFVPLGQTAIQKLRDSLGDDIHTTIILYLRNPEQWVPSIWAQVVKMGRESRPLDEYIETLSDNHIYDMVHHWIVCFGKENINLRLYDEVVQYPGLLNDFWNVIGIPANISADFVASKNQNISLSPLMTELILSINQRVNFQNPALINRPLNQHYYSWLTEFGHYTHKKYGKITAFPPQDILDLIRRKFALANRRLAQEFFERDRLFPQHAEATIPSENSDVTISEDDLLELHGFIAEKIMVYEASLQEAKHPQQLNKKINDEWQQALGHPYDDLLLRLGYSYLKLQNFPVFGAAAKILNFWQIRLTTRLVKNHKLQIPDLFNADWYLAAYPEVQKSGIHPYIHFHLFGWYQGYQPMPLFDVNWYIRQYPDFNQEGMNPLEHYERVGKFKRYQPYPLFQPGWYLNTYKDVQKAGVDPLFHYCYTGWREGRNPSSQFNTNKYLKQKPELKTGDINPLAHYVQHKRLSQSEHLPIVDQEVDELQSHSQQPVSNHNHAIEILNPILERANNTTNLESAIRILRELPLGDFALLTLKVPDEYANLKHILPQMANSEDQLSWTGASGVTLLQQTVDFVKSVHITMHETGMNHHMDQRKVLDFGMGWGRIIRLMYWLFKPENIFAVDPMQSSIDVCKKNNVTAHVRKIEKIVTTLPFDEKFDLIYAFSVFTHLSQESAMAAQRTLRQHMTHDGLLAITVRPVEYWQYVNSQGKLSDEDLETLVNSHHTTGYSFKPHNNRPNELNANTYGDCTYSLKYIEQTWKAWKIIKVDRNFSDPLQVYVYLRSAE